MEYSDPLSYYNYDKIKKKQKKNVTGSEPPNPERSEDEKKKWKNVQNKINCYGYAMDVSDPSIYFPQPGMFGVPNMSKFIGMDREFTCSNYHTRLLMDNPHMYPIKHKDKCKQGYYKMYFVISPNRDFHLYKQSDDGTYTHKPGSTPVTSLDSSKKKIIDPQYSDRYVGSNNDSQIYEPELFYMTVCNSYCVPKEYVFLE